MGQIHEMYLVSRPTHGLVDPGAGSDLVGRDSLNREAVELARLGLTYVVVPLEHRAPRRAHGVG
eukprot:8561103-Pyramimonas_sp.AAC.1